MKSLEFDPSAFEDLAWWIQQDRKKALRLVKLIKEVQRTPFTGTLAALLRNTQFIGQTGLIAPFGPVRHSAKRRRIKTVIQELMYDWTADRNWPVIEAALQQALPGLHRV